MAVVSVSGTDRVMREVAGEHALYFEPDNLAQLREQIERVMGDTSLRERLIAGGRETAQRFSWDGSARRMLEIFRRAPARFFGSNRRPTRLAAETSPRIGVLITGTRGAHGVPAPDVRDDHRHVLASAG